MAKYCILLALLVTVAYGLDYYPNKYDNFDVDRVIRNNRILNSYIRCLLDEGYCTPEAREIKDMLADVLQTTCSKCTPKQRMNVKKIVNHITTRKPKEWARLSAKYDPEGQYQKHIDKWMNMN
ncbi:PREDICTED: ejaculatory bulb-specific protein 3-like [Polistes dominula]|uniref:Ejaculatory bulb-specific protein 3-like n=1 Tax=Polistes dominula TaxID=743375 RepID=A0ABM1IBA4_POLDO|nr:PREDICTED: ejaculatory bulb-specific protein 3-like [Polistes dominula]XP_015177491.1 PREDICTED: ejaculatory bulb-specific protein 3-like [Polistes dominula]